MTFVSSSKVADDVSRSVKKISEYLSSNKAQQVLSEVDQKHAYMPYSKLFNLFHYPDENKNTFRILCKIKKIIPESTY